MVGWFTPEGTDVVTDLELLGDVSSDDSEVRPLLRYSYPLGCGWEGGVESGVDFVGPAAPDFFITECLLVGWGADHPSF